MPDWAQNTQRLAGRAPKGEPWFLHFLVRFLASLGRGLLSLCGTVLISLGLTVLVNPPLREALWEWLRQFW